MGEGDPPPSALHKAAAVAIAATGALVVATTILWLPVLLLLLWPLLLATAAAASAAALLSAAAVYRLDPELLRRALPDSLFRLLLAGAETYSAVAREARRIRSRRLARARSRPHSHRVLLPHPDTSQFLPSVDSIAALRLLEKHGDYPRLIPHLRKMLRRDKALYAQPWVAAWIARRWRFHFLVEAARDPHAVAVARAANRPWRTALLGAADPRSDYQCLAQRFLRGYAPQDHLLVTGDHTTVAMPEFHMPDARFLNVGLLFAPGLLNGLLPVRAFHPALQHCAERFGIPVMRADSHPMRGCDANVADIMAAISHSRGRNADTSFSEGQQGTPPFDKFLAVGYSKGVPDLLATYVQHEDFRARCRGIISWAGAIGGSYLANDAYENIPVQDIDSILLQVNPLLGLNPMMPKVRTAETNITHAVHDLTTAAREEFNMHNYEMLDSMDIPVLCFSAACPASEVPYFQIQASLKLRGFDANNDMQLIEPQTVLQSATSVQVARLRGNHWDVAYPRFPKTLQLGSRRLDHPFPKTAAMAAHIMLAIELGILTDDSIDDEL